MAIYNGNKLAKKLYVGTKPVRAVYAGSQKVWPSVVRVARGVNYGAWTYADPVRRRTATPWEQDIYCDDSVGDVRYGATSTQEETATVSYNYGSWSYADPKRSRTKTTIYKYSDTTRTGGTVTETQTAATAVDWDGSTYWNGSCGSNYYYVDYKKVRTRYTYNDVTRYSGYYNGDSRSRRIEGLCGWVRDWRVLSDWANNGYTCNAAGTRGAYDCSSTYCVRYNQQQRTLSYCFPDKSGNTQTKVEYRAGSENSRAQEDGKCGYSAKQVVNYLTNMTYNDLGVYPSEEWAGGNYPEYLILGVCGYMNEQMEFRMNFKVKQRVTQNGSTTERRLMSNDATDSFEIISRDPGIVVRGGFNSGNCNIYATGDLGANFHVILTIHIPEGNDVYVDVEVTF